MDLSLNEGKVENFKYKMDQSWGVKGVSMKRNGREFTEP